MPTTVCQFHLIPILLMSALLFASSCGSDGPFQPVGEAEEERIKGALDNRSFRQLLPSKDASPRKAVVLDFFDGIRVWAQYAEKRHAVNEWEIAPRRLPRLKDREQQPRRTGGHNPEFMIYLENPTFTQQFPTACEGLYRRVGLLRLH